jgi:hypothetical protein
MAAILGLEDIDVEAACAEASARRGGGGGEFQCARAGGDCRVRRGRARAIEAATAKGARRALPLPISVPRTAPSCCPRRNNCASGSRARRRAGAGVRSMAWMSKRTQPDEIRKRAWSNSCIRRCIGRRRCEP